MDEDYAEDVEEDEEDEDEDEEEAQDSDDTVREMPGLCKAGGEQWQWQAGKRGGEGGGLKPAGGSETHPPLAWHCRDHRTQCLPERLQSLHDFYSLVDKC